MSKLIQCDSCGRQASDVFHRCGGFVVDAGAGSSDGWASVQIQIARETSGPSGILHCGPGPFYTNVPSAIELCPDCAKRMIEASDVKGKIATEIPDYTTSVVGTAMMY